jgi:hypothetical protein
VPGTILKRGDAVSALQRTSGIIAALSLLLLPSAATAQRNVSSGKSPETIESRSATLAAELTQLLSAQNLDSIATADADAYVGALYIPAAQQLLVVRAKLPLKDRMSYLLYNKMYRDAYADLNSASDAATRLLISDLGANGLHFKHQKDQPFDMVNLGGRSVAFDGKWGGKAGISRDEYTKSYESTDEQYTQMLQALIAALKKSS